jgi:RHS repeat-associated protein
VWKQDLLFPVVFAGEQLDPTGLYYNQARYYDPKVGRFTQPDTYKGNAFDSGVHLNSLPLSFSEGRTSVRPYKPFLHLPWSPVQGVSEINILLE